MSSFEHKINANPTVYTTSVAQHSYNLEDLNDDDDFPAEDDSRDNSSGASEGDSAGRQSSRRARDTIDSLEIFEMIRHLNDPEHPLTLEQLNVTQLSLIEVDDANNTVDVHFTPTIPHCSMATLIGLSLRVKLLRALPSRFKVTVKITPGAHNSEEAVNKQLNDKERVAAALENGSLLDVVNKCVGRTDKDTEQDLLAQAWRSVGATI